MDAFGELRTMGKKINNRGIAVVFLAVGMIALIGIVGLAVDIGYMYVAKAQLQNAADAAALAGAAKLKRIDSPLFQQYSARAYAINFASNNTAAQSPVVIASVNSTDVNTGNILTDPTISGINGANDITFGNWTPAGYVRYDGTVGTPINAIQVRARRTVPGATAENQGQVRIFFGKIFALLPGGGAGWPFMSASAEAIAVKQPFIGPFPICLHNCGFYTPLNGQWDYDFTSNPNEVYCSDPGLGVNGSPPGQLFQFNSSNDTEGQRRPGLAWTNFSFTSSCSGTVTQPTPGDVSPFLQGTPAPDVCGQYISTSNGDLTNVLAAVQPLLSANSKPYTFPVNDPSTGNPVTINGWLMFVPVLLDSSCGVSGQACPGAPAGTPYQVLRYAKVLVTDVITTGTHGIRLVGVDNPNLSTPWTLTTSVSCNSPPRTVPINRLVSSIGCTDCFQNLDTTGMAGVIKLVHK